MDICKYSKPGELTWEASTLRDENHTFIKIRRLSKEASHILFFKGKNIITEISESQMLSNPDYICDAFDLLRRQGGIVSFGQPVSPYIGVTAKYTNDVYFIDQLNIKEFIAGTHLTIQYSININKAQSIRNYNIVTISFLTTPNTNFSVIPFEDLYYTVEGIDIKYLIHPQMIKKNSFTIYVPPNKKIKLSGMPNSQIRAYQVN